MSRTFCFIPFEYEAMDWSAASASPSSSSSLLSVLGHGDQNGEVTTESEPLLNEWFTYRCGPYPEHRKSGRLWQESSDQ